MAEESAGEATDREAKRMVCPDCFHENYPDADFCGKCVRPITAYSMIGPLERVYALGWTYRRAASGRIPLIGLVGMWACFVSSLVWWASVLFDVPHQGFLSVMHLILGVPLIVLYVAFLFCMTRNYLRIRRERGTEEGA